MNGEYSTKPSRNGRAADGVDGSLPPASTSAAAEGPPPRSTLLFIPCDPAKRNRLGNMATLTRGGGYGIKIIPPIVTPELEPMRIPPKKVPKLKFCAAIFDMDGVIADNMAYHTKAWEMFLQKYAPGFEDRRRVLEVWHDQYRPDELRPVAEAVARRSRALRGGEGAVLQEDLRRGHGPPAGARRLPPGNKSLGNARRGGDFRPQEQRQLSPRGPQGPASISTPSSTPAR